MQKNNNKVSEGLTGAFGYLYDFQLVLITLDKMMIFELFMDVLEKDRRRIEEGSPKGNEIDKC